MKAILFAASTATLLAAAPASALGIDFEDLAVGTSALPTQTLMTGGEQIIMRDFTFSGGTTFSGGIASVEAGGLAGGSGNEIAVNNILLDLVLGAVSNLQLAFGEYGGNLNIEVNGDFVNFDNFVDIDGMTIGGTLVSVTNGSGQDRGSLFLSGGTISQFAIGGQELWVDDIFAETAPVPLPASVLLLGAALGGLGAIRRRRS